MRRKSGYTSSLFALIGLSAFYGLERLARTARARRRFGAHGTAAVFWLHVGSFAIYNVLIGYLLLHREEAGLASLLFYVAAMAVHFLTNDFGLRQDHRERYDERGRWMLAGATLVGWGMGAVTMASAAAVGSLFAFLAGGVVLNVLKEELPEEHESRFLPFAVGAAAYGVLLVMAGAI